MYEWVADQVNRYFGYSRFGYITVSDVVDVEQHGYCQWLSEAEIDRVLYMIEEWKLD